MRRTLTALSVAAALTLAGCSDSSGGDGSGAADRASADPRPAAEVLQDAAVTTFEARSLRVSGELDVEIAPDEFAIAAEGAVDYDALVCDFRFRVEDTGGVNEVEVRADGESLWLRTAGDDTDPVPEGRTWAGGDATLLEDSFVPAAMLGLVLVLSAAEDVQEGETGEVDGVSTREFTTSVSYRDAVRAAGERAEELQSVLGLTGQAEQAEFDITVAVGEDDVVRDLDFVIDAGRAPVGGRYQVEIRDVGDEVPEPETPDEADILTGPAADRFLAESIQ